MYCGDTINTVVDVSPEGIRFHPTGSSFGGVHVIAPSTPIYRDDLGVLGRPQRHRKQRTFFVTGDNPKAPKLPPKLDASGEDLIGSTFLSADSPGDDPVMYTVTGCTDTASATLAYGNLYTSSVPPPILQYQPTDSLGQGDPLESTVAEVRRWVGATKSQDLHATLMKVVPLPRISPPVSSVHLLLSRFHLAAPARKVPRTHLVDILNGHFKPYATNDY